MGARLDMTFTGWRAAVAAAALSLLGVAAPAAAQTAEGLVIDYGQVDRISTYLNELDTMSGEFVQVAPDGVISEGAYYLRRPGRLRFEYQRPQQLMVISDGFWVAVLEGENDRSVDRYPLSETPLHMLLKEDVNLSEEARILDVTVSEGQLRLKATDDSQAGEITLVFDNEPLRLRQWIITDPQGYTTTIALRSATVGERIDPAQFTIPEPRRTGRDD